LAEEELSNVQLASVFIFVFVTTDQIV